MNIDQIITAGAGVVALYIVFRLAFDWQGDQKKLFVEWQADQKELLAALNTTVANNTKVTAEMSKTMETISLSFQQHDKRSVEMEAKLESMSETVEAKLKENLYSNQVIRDNVVEIKTHLQQGRR